MQGSSTPMPVRWLPRHQLCPACCCLLLADLAPLLLLPGHTQAFLTKLLTKDLPALITLPQRLEINIPPAVTAGKCCLKALYNALPEAS